MSYSRKISNTLWKSVRYARNKSAIRKGAEVLDWITSWPSVIFGSVGLLACVVGLLIEQFRTDRKQRANMIQPEDIRRIKKAAVRDISTDSGKRMEK